MGIAGTVTSAVSSTSVTMPKENLNIVGVGCQKHTIGGYLTLNIDPGHQAILPFSTQRGVTTTDVPVNQVLPDNMWLVNFKAGLKVLYTGTGLSSGTFFFYYGTTFSTPMQNSKPLKSFAGVEVDVTTGTSLSFTFPGTITVAGLAYDAGYNTAETNVATDFQWNTGTGILVDVNVNNKDPLAIFPLENMGTAQSLTVTAAFDGTHVATGRLVLYYSYS